MDKYTQLLEFFMENGVQLDREQMEELKAVCEAKSKKEKSNLQDIICNTPANKATTDELITMANGVRSGDIDGAVKQIAAERLDGTHDINVEKEKKKQEKAKAKFNKPKDPNKGNLH